MKKISKILTYPFKLIFLGIIYFYKLCISPILPKTCRFMPSCSTYMVQAINEFGAFKGVWLGTKRVVKCGPWSKGGVDPVPLNMKGEIKWLL